MNWIAVRLPNKPIGNLWHIRYHCVKPNAITKLSPFNQDPASDCCWHLLEKVRKMLKNSSTHISPKNLAIPTYSPTGSRIWKKWSKHWTWCKYFKTLIKNLTKGKLPEKLRLQILGKRTWTEHGWPLCGSSTRTSASWISIWLCKFSQPRLTLS